jgi:translation elongation factor aEF-1 beta
MGTVIIAFRILPDSPDSFNQVKAGVQALDPERVEEEAIAFGLKAINVIFMIPDAGGEQDMLENKLKDIPNVSTVETTKVTRSL